MKISVSALLFMFMVGFLTNSVIRRVVLSPMPPDTIYPCLALAACSLGVFISIHDVLVRQK